MHLRAVEIFCEVVQQRSFSKAAAQYDVSQSSASQAVQMLEDRLGARLIDRSKRPFELTPAGQLYYEGCRELLRSFQAIEDRVHKLQGRVTGTVRVAAIYSVGLLEVDSYVRRFESLFPEADLKVEYVNSDGVEQYIREDRAEIGLASFPQGRGDLCSIPWQEQEMVLVVSPHHRLAGRDSVTVQELNGEDFVGFKPELRIHTQVRRWLRQSDVSVNVVHTFDNIENIKRAVEIATGVAILPRPTVRREAALGSLMVIRLADVSWHRPLGILHNKHRVFSTAVSKFIELLHEDPATFPSQFHSDVEPGHQHHIEATIVSN